MKTLVSYIKESFQDTILKEYFAYANKSDDRTKRLLTSFLLGTSDEIDLHNVKGEKQTFDKDDNAASINRYFNKIIKNAHTYIWSEESSSVVYANMFIIKMQKDNDVVFGLFNPDNTGWDNTDITTFDVILPDDINTQPLHYSVYKHKKACSIMEQIIKSGWDIIVYRYVGNGTNPASELYKLRKERQTNKDGVFDNSEEFLSYYKEKQVQKRLLTIIRNASKKANSDYKTMLDEANEQIKKMLQFVDNLDKETQSKSRKDSIKNSYGLNKILKFIDKKVIEATEMLNSPELYTDSFDVDKFKKIIYDIKDSVEDAYYEADDEAENNSK